MRLYKFRPLADSDDSKRLKTILESGEFHCSKFSELNDPMEGSFTCGTPEIADAIYSEKESYRICSFSTKRALSKPTMWGYYANGFKGVAIEIEVDPNEVKPINYIKTLLHLETANQSAEKILTTKLVSWKAECEYRFLKKENKEKQKIGKIQAIYFGNPYQIARNRAQIFENSQKLQEYEQAREKILKSVANLKVYFVGIMDSRVAFNKIS